MAATKIAKSFILGDWGTTRLRLYLLRDDGRDLPAIAGHAEGPGIKGTTDFKRTFLDCAQQLPPHETGSVILSGMIGSSLGWLETPYLLCPLDWNSLSASSKHCKADGYAITILPGASCDGRFAYPEIMRGEETQLRGLAQLESSSQRARLVCLPGTHTKWAIIDHTGLQQFATTLQGELYDLLITGSVLVANHQRKPVRESAINTGVFADGVDLIRVNKDLGLLEALFSTRSRQVLAELDSEDAASYLSGIVIGADVRDTGLPMLQTAAIANNVEPPVQLVGATVLVQLYAQALARSDISVEEFDGDAAVIAGLIAATSHT